MAGTPRMSSVEELAPLDGNGFRTESSVGWSIAVVPSAVHLAVRGVSEPSTPTCPCEVVTRASRTLRT
ncbi:hypothetical protein CLV40_11510 [Actinokineospora auranticolor]|uniref:Uncharacterized protein n=1 Tax=Actinokineospora auranticolor TaxID=155976 RepID=A0A2S6GIZ8_9PSEU|nr:hypothetical protein CLV40_11510 [Actinokineospora auranticolor]